MPTLNRDPYGYADPDWEEPFSRWVIVCFAIAVPFALIIWGIAMVVVVGHGMAKIAWEDSRAAIRKRFGNAPRR